MILSRSVNEFVPKSKWVASLSNGETIFQDYRNGLPAAWIRLATYVKINKLAITKIRVQIAGLELKMPAHKDGYVYKKKVGSYGGGSTCMRFCMGHVEDGRVLMHYLGEDRSSETRIESDPGPPNTIYRHDIECKRSCCNADI